MDWDPLIRVALAAVLSLPIGLERELRGKPAGLRTHMVVATACAALGYLSLLAADGFPGADRTRIASQVVVGIGFIGAGVTFSAAGKVHGLTTAAAIFSAMAIGLAAGMGQPWLAAALVLVTMLLLWPVDLIAVRLLAAHRRDEWTFHLVADGVGRIADAQQLMRRYGATGSALEIQPFNGSIAAMMTVECRRDAARAIQDELGRLDGIESITDEALAERLE